MTPLQRRRARGGGTLGSSNISRLTNRMSNLNMSTTTTTTTAQQLGTGGTGGVNSSVTFSSAATMAASSGGLNMSSVLSSGTYEQSLSAEEVTYAEDLIQAQSKTIAESARKAEELELLLSELKTAMAGQRG